MKVIILFFLSSVFVESYCQSSPNIVVQRENFIYAGIDNFIIIEGLNEIEKPVVSVIKGAIKKAGTQSYYVKPANENICKIVVGSLLDTIQYILTIKVKPVPQPDVFLNGGLHSGHYKVTQLKAIDSLVLIFNDFAWKGFFKTESFKITRISKGSLESSINIGASCNSKTKELFNKAKAKDIYIIDSVFYSIGQDPLQLAKSIVLRIE